MIGLKVKLTDGAVAQILQHAQGLFYILDEKGKHRWINRDQVNQVANEHGKFTEQPSPGAEKKDTSEED